MPPAPTHTRARARASFVGSTPPPPLAPRFDSLKLRFERTNFEGRIASANLELLRQREVVREREWDYIGLFRERGQVSPRAVAQGFVEALDVDLRKMRKMVTKEKLAALFEYTLPVRRLEDQKAKMLEELKVAEYRANQLEKWRDAEIEALWARKSALRWKDDAKTKKQRVALQRRKWAVEHFTASGKPDKRRRPGRPWDADAYAGPEKHTLCVVGGGGRPPAAGMRSCPLRRPCSVAPAPLRSPRPRPRRLRAPDTLRRRSRPRARPRRFRSRSRWCTRRASSTNTCSTSQS